MERQCRVVQQSAMGPVIVGVSVEQEIDDIDAQQQEQLANAAVHRAQRPTEQQQYRRQHVVQRSEELVQHDLACDRLAAKQQCQRCKEVAEARRIGARHENTGAARKAGILP